MLQAIDLVGTLRIEKSAEEIQAISKACALGDAAFLAIRSQLQNGISEKKVSEELEIFIKRHGATISFPPVIAFGENASKPHHVATARKLKPHDVILLDFGIKIDSYCSDMTRTLINDAPTAEQTFAYEIVLASQQKAITFIKEQLSKKQKIIAKQVDAIARNFIIAKEYPNMPHSLGHGIGLLVHEPPRLTLLSQEELANCMVFSLEPGIYLPGKFGIRIEDLFAIQNNSLIQLTKAASELMTI